MANFQYEALDASGKPTAGSIEAATSEEAIQEIRGQGLFPTSVTQDDGGGKKSGKYAGKKKKKKKEKPAKSSGDKEKKKGISLSLPSIGGVPVKLLTQFTRQLSTLQDAGLPLLR